jgi:hypothetical protein
MSEMKELTRAIALAKAYEVMNNSSCQGCGLPCTRYTDSWATYWCDTCTPPASHGEVHDRCGALAVRLLMRIAKGE